MIDPDKIPAAFLERRNVYRIKATRADPFADDIMSRWDMFNSMAEAIEWLAQECGIELPDFEEPE